MIRFFQTVDKTLWSMRGFHLAWEIVPRGTGGVVATHSRQCARVFVTRAAMFVLSHDRISASSSMILALLISSYIY